jgi:hypothetical protein
MIPASGRQLTELLLDFLEMTAIGDLEVVDDDQLVVELGHLVGPSLGSVARVRSSLAQTGSCEGLA